jgi:hypothetical protein
MAALGPTAQVIQVLHFEYNAFSSKLYYTKLACNVYPKIDES